MLNTFAQDMKKAIVADLESLVTSGVLNSCVADDMTKVSPLDRNWPGYPSALVIPPTVSSSEYYDVATNLREYTWFVLIVTKADSMPANDPTYLEGLIDAILKVFDEDVTLQGMANGGVQPAILDPPGPVSSNSVTYVIFSVQLKAKQLVPAAVQSAN
jgi:hypothetical protein